VAAVAVAVLVAFLAVRVAQAVCLAILGMPVLQVQLLQLVRVVRVARIQAVGTTLVRAALAVLWVLQAHLAVLQHTASTHLLLALVRVVQRVTPSLAIATSRGTTLELG
jgi:hypothetical protein